MKKLISMISALALCAGIMTAITANAEVISLERVLANGIVYEKMHDLDEYFEFDKNAHVLISIYKSAEKNTYDEYTYIYVSKYLDVNDYEGNQAFSTCNIDLTLYDELSEEEFKKLSDYLLKEYPDLNFEAVEITNPHIKITGAENLSFDEQLQIAEDIKENVGIRAFFCPYEDYVAHKTVGDINSDNAITASDAAMVLSYYAQGQTSTASAYAEGEADYSIIADYNNDGAVTSVDAALILSDYAEGQIS